MEKVLRQGPVTRARALPSTCRSRPQLRTSRFPRARLHTIVPRSGYALPKFKWSTVAITAVVLATYGWTTAPIKAEEAVASSSESESEPSTGIEFPKTLVLQNATGPLHLVGLGLRTVSFLSIRVYVAAFYMSSQARDFIAKQDSQSLSKGKLLSKDGEKLFEALLETPTEFAIHIEPTRATNFSHWRDSFVRSMTNRLALYSKDLSEDAANDIAEAINSLKTFFPNTSAPKGKALTLLRKADHSLAVEYDGKTLGLLKNRFIADNLILAYFAQDNVISAKLQNSVAEGLAVLQARQ